MRPQQSSRNHLPSLKSQIVKEDVASRQAPETPPSEPIGGRTVASGSRPEVPPAGGGDNGGGTISPPSPIQPVKTTTFVASFKLDRMRAGLQMGDFLDEVMSHLNALPGAEVNMSVEVQVKVPDGIDDATVRIVLENSRSLKANDSQIY